MIIGLLAIIVSQTPAIELRLTTRGGDTVCPDEASLRERVSRQLGYSPFRPAAEAVYAVQVTCARLGCEGSLTITRPSEEPFFRAFSSDAGRCDDLFESIASAVTQASSYESEIGRRLNTVEAPAPLPVAPAGPEPAPASKPKTTSALTFKGTLVGGVSAGLSNEPTPVLGGGLGVAWRRFSLMAEGRLDLNQSLLVSNASVVSAVVVGTLSPCVHAWGFGACLLFSSAAVHVKGDLQKGARDSAAIFLLGPRVMYEWMFFDHVGLHLHASLQGAFSTLSVKVTDDFTWTTSRITGDLVAGFVVVF